MSSIVVSWWSQCFATTCCFRVAAELSPEQQQQLLRLQQLLGNALEEQVIPSVTRIFKKAEICCKATLGVLFVVLVRGRGRVDRHGCGRGRPGVGGVGWTAMGVGGIR